MRSIIILLITTLLFFSGNYKCNAQDFTLNAKVLDLGWSSGLECNWPSEYLSVEMSLKNITNTTKSFWIMRNSWQDSFISDVDSVEFLLKEYSANFPKDFELKPSQLMIFNCIIKIPEVALKHKEFKIGFVLFNERGLMDQHKMDIKTWHETIKAIETIWSNPLPMRHKDILGYEISN